MSTFNKLALSWNGVFPTMTKFLQDWRPPRLRAELNYRDQLVSELRKALPDDTKIEKEYRHRGTTFDVWVERKALLSREEVGLELKVNLKRKTDYDRLVGQIEGMDPAKNKTIVVLIGDTDESLLARLTQRYSKFTPEGRATLMDDATFAVVCVPVPER